MNRMRIAAAAAVGVAAAAAFAAFALRRDETTGDESEVAQLRREVAELRAKLGGDVRGLASIDLPAKMELLGRPFPLDKPEIREAVAYEIVLTVGKPTMPLLWIWVMPASVSRSVRNVLAVSPLASCCCAFWKARPNRRK